MKFDNITSSNLKTENKTSFKEMYKIYNELKINQAKIWGIPVKFNSLIPENEVWVMKNRDVAFKIINIGNSKLYKFILWWQEFVRKIKNIFIK